MSSQIGKLKHLDHKYEKLHFLLFFNIKKLIASTIILHIYVQI